MTSILHTFGEIWPSYRTATSAAQLPKLTLQTAHRAVCLTLQRWIRRCFFQAPSPTKQQNRNLAVAVCSTERSACSDIWTVDSLFLRKKPRRLRRATGAPPRAAFRIHRPKKNTVTPDGVTVFLVGEGGFEPPKSVTTDLQSAPFGHSGIPPYSIRCETAGAGRRTRTPDLLITNQLLYQLSYTSISATEIILTEKSQFVNMIFENFGRKFCVFRH